MSRHSEPMFETKRAALASDFGYDWAVKLFGRNAIESLPKLQSGPNKGKPKGFVLWKKAISSGYSRSYCQPVKPGTLVRAWIGEGQFSLESDAMYGQFMGRTQAICASRSLLFEDGRKAWMQANGDNWTEGD